MEKDQEKLKKIEKPRARVYIDGFNLYFSVLQQTPQSKWLNLESFFDELRLDDQIDQIHYFTAIVEPERPTSVKRDHQALYLQALSTLPRVKITYGRYQRRRVRCAGACREVYNVPEEKKTDVNLALAMVDDALHHRVDRIILVSGDSDLEPAIEYIRKNCPKVALFVYIPQLPQAQNQRNNRNYAKIGAKVKALPIQTISKHQFPDMTTLTNGQQVAKPADW